MDIAAARECVGDLAGLSLDDALFAATAGDVAATDRALELALAEGAAAVQVVRAGLRHVQRLQRARAAMAAGVSAAEAARAVRPPLYFRRQRAFAAGADALDPGGAGVGSDSDFGRRSGRASGPVRRPRRIARNAVVGVAQRAAARRR